ncbi:uncharacterized protein LOC142320474 isoform X2 [Lycorma delicatula]|uniref:uncharacterized protein LOC142320474 isoform X2 n=1 Tax=Lycorma delicatula TaxID=130591 RepID=UPI003F519774
MTAIHWSNYDEVRNVLENCDNSELIVNCRSGPMMMLPLLQLASYLRNQQDAVKIVKLLLNHGAKANCCDKIGRTPLHYAAILGSEDVVRLLLEAGASPNNRYVLMPWKNDGSYNSFRCSHGLDCAREVTAANNYVKKLASL